MAKMMANKMRKIQSLQGKKAQQGVVLLVALVMLLVITIIGVSAVNITKDKTQVAGNSMYTLLAYQGAESALARSVTGKAQMNLRDAAKAGGVFNVPASHLSDSNEKINGIAKMDSSATISPLNGTACAIVSGVAGSTGTGFQCKVFRVSAETSLALTGARTRHTEGREVNLPKP